jgi:hypothetical protein
MKLSCAQVQDVLALTVPNDVLKQNNQAVQEHINQCVSCRHMLYELNGDHEQLKQFVQSLEPVIDKMESDAIKRIPECAIARKNVSTAWMKWAVAAVFMAALGLGLLNLPDSDSRIASNQGSKILDIRHPENIYEPPVTAEPIGTPVKTDNASEKIMSPLSIELPVAMFIGTPKNLPGVERLESPRLRARPVFYAPKGTRNIALGKPVSGNTEPYIGDLQQIVDGDKEALEGSYVEFVPGLNYVTIDLEKAYEIYAVVFWHFHNEPRAYYDVVLQAANAPDFSDAITLFNNDNDGSAGLGVGDQLNYVETNEGKLIDARGVHARYIRLFGQGNSINDLNHLIEMEVYGKALPAPDVSQYRIPDLQPLPIELPRPTFVGTPRNISGVTDLMKPRGGPRPPFYAPTGVVNISRGCEVVSGSVPVFGQMDQLTDGDKEALYDSIVELPAGPQQVTLDLGDDYEIYAVVVWRNHRLPRVYFDVICRISSNPDFENPAVLFNNDMDNSSGLGAGNGLHYVETSEGFLMDALGTVGRYVRFCSNGNHIDQMNHYTEIEVYGRPVR